MALSAPSPFTASALVAAGGALGALARFHVGGLVAGLTQARGGETFPWATLGVNIAGSLLIGALTGWLARGTTAAGTTESLRLLLGVGLLGGFTTFSAFSAELVTMLHRGQTGAALLYAAASLVAGMAAVILGLVAGQSAP